MLIYLLNIPLINSLLRCQTMLHAQNTKMNRATNLEGSIPSGGDKNVIMAIL